MNIPEYLLERKIIHIDMDAFFASVEQRDHPELRGKPIAVGGSPTGRGVVAAASYEARKFGVRSAMSSARAIKLCPQLIFSKSRFDVYRRISRVIMAILREYSELVEPISIDEAYLDVTFNKKGFRYASQVAKEIRKKIYSYTGLTASAGVAPNKFLAKIASDLNKPNGMAIIQPETALQFLSKLPIRKIHGVGKVTEEKFLQLGIQTVGDLQAISEFELCNNFGKSGSWYFKLARGEDRRPVKVLRTRKSIGIEDTFVEDIIDLSEMATNLKDLASRLEVRMRKSDSKGKTITLKIKYSDFKLITRAVTLNEFISDEENLFSTAKSLLKASYDDSKPVRLLGISVSNLEHENRSAKEQRAQLNLF
ncbi:MAG: DNA polymerase IV [Bdellovibrionales bacterium]|nr:DNA polymerase IV [Bdellovibrionales bacterium]